VIAACRENLVFFQNLASVPSGVSEGSYDEGDFAGTCFWRVEIVLIFEAAWIS
jgi:hypothetical protein